MRLLLDTHVVLWQLSGERPLSEAAASAIAHANDLLFSAVSYAEIGVKATVGKISVPTTLRQHASDAGLRTLNLTAEHGLAVAQLPPCHRDPFDRLLIAQALIEGLTIVTADRRFALYPVPLVDAG